MASEGVATEAGWSQVSPGNSGRVGERKTSDSNLIVSPSRFSFLSDHESAGKDPTFSADTENIENDNTTESQKNDTHVDTNLKNGINKTGKEDLEDSSDSNHQEQAGGKGQSGDATTRTILPHQSKASHRLIS